MLMVSVSLYFSHTSSRMTAGSSKHPSNWRLWHPNQGIIFQQPLYPILDVARFFTTAETRHGAQDISTNVHQLGGIEEEGFTAGLPEEGRIALEESGAYSVGGNVEEGLKESRLDEEATKTRTEHSEEAICDGPPFTPLDYNISDSAFRAAKTAPEGSAESFWSYTMYRGPSDPENGQEETKVKVHYCRSSHTAERALQYLVNEKVLGLDLEWAMEANRHSGPRRNVSLVQLASQSRVVLLHIAMYPAKDTLATPTLKKILEDSNITKLGVAVKGDCTRLRKFLGIDSMGVFELSHLFNQVKHISSGTPELINKKLVSLANQVQQILGLPMFKGQNVRMSDWTRPLDIGQISYSASDAYAVVQIFAILNHQRQNLNPTPALPFHIEHNRPIPLPPGIETSSSDNSGLEEIMDEAEIDAEGAGDTSASFLKNFQWLSEAKAKLEAEGVDGVKVDLLSERIKAVAESIELEDDGGSETATNKTLRKKASSSTKPTVPTRGPIDPTDSRIVAAEAWYAEYKATRPGGKTKATAAKVRAYFMWHTNKDLVPEAMARLLRIQKNTVISYILEAVNVEGLPYDRVRMKTEVVDHLPEDIVQRRYRTIWRATKDIIALPG